MKKFAYFAAVSIAVIAQSASAQVPLTGKISGAFRMPGRSEIKINGITVDVTENVANGTFVNSIKVTDVGLLTGSLNCVLDGPLSATTYTMIVCKTGTNNVGDHFRMPGRSTVKINGATVDVTQNVTNGTLILVRTVTDVGQVAGDATCVARGPLPAPKYKNIACTSTR